MSATLRVSRDTFGIELRRGVFEVSVDGKAASAITPGQTVELPLAPGHHTLRIRAGRYTSHQETFDLADDEAIDFSCSGAIFWPRWVLSFVRPDLGILLKRGDPYPPLLSGFRDNSKKNRRQGKDLGRYFHGGRKACYAHAHLPRSFAAVPFGR